MGARAGGRSAAGISRASTDEAEQAKIGRLKREVAKLKMERDILKKAAARSTGRHSGCR
jgi:transposase-like protein